jgi:hypothetical protein
VIDWGARVNDAYIDFLWETDSVHGPSIAINTVGGQGEYLLPSPDWKKIDDVFVNGIPLRKYSEIQLRSEDPYWLIRPSGTPVYWWLIRHNTLQVFPTPDTSITSGLVVYGIRAPVLLTATDIPLLPTVLHEFIATYAAYLGAKPYAKGETRSVLADRYAEYIARREEWKHEQLMRNVNGAERMVGQITSDRILG